MITYVCAWCSKAVPGKPIEGTTVSHGICEKCASKMRIDFLHRKMRSFAEMLICWEQQRRTSSQENPLPVSLVIEKLRPHLSTLMGQNGFRALLSRALILARIESPWLRAVQVEANGSLTLALNSEEDSTTQKVLKGGVALLVKLFGLLVAFIGELLTLHLVREVWPNLPLNDWDLSKGSRNEKEK